MEWRYTLTAAGLYVVLTAWALGIGFVLGYGLGSLAR